MSRGRAGPRTIDDQRVHEVATRSLETKPGDAMHRRTRSLGPWWWMGRIAVRG